VREADILSQSNQLLFPALTPSGSAVRFCRAAFLQLTLPKAPIPKFFPSTYCPIWTGGSIFYFVLSSSAAMAVKGTTTLQRGASTFTSKEVIIFFVCDVVRQPAIQCSCAACMRPMNEIQISPHKVTFYLLA
jgi:hypothetical protein